MILSRVTDYLKNHRRAALEAAAGSEKPKGNRGRKAKPDDSHGDLFA